MRSLFAFIFISLLSPVLWGQAPIDTLLLKYNTRSVPYISVNELKARTTDYLILDTRKKEEFEVSHLPNAVWVGEQLDAKKFTQLYTDKTQPIVVYCSVGIRSEKFGENLQRKGYTNVSNLYGSLFAWKDKGYPVLNMLEKPTDSVHVFSKEWSSYLKNGIKIY